MPSNNLIKNSRITEKASLLKGENKYVFDVDLKANKSEIKKDLEKSHKINVVSVNIVRNGRRKKAIVALKEGQTINEKV
ncbi:MAG: 50S ribosomal protein L23 [Candidatus Colwellbacteria bacterium]|jgi:large subunit ribosomal protein L23|nr:50S ribosomal protein L23 [Candidatus Colwellbacteria bacterium]MCK9497444.1 50S ribosomal protein L23 [Candidatus Colwellbacteria bacterium]MDD3752522.1 50S ribosomal protein L23 [Candidatus Colwellbacteria bacterium]MDD4819077.1 50S ribosomal protein L23 [Candidatus Colwellbacteria bacterium]